MKYKKKWFEIKLPEIAYFAISRNVEKSLFISRKDNNKLFLWECELREIIKNMKKWVLIKYLLFY